MLHITTTDNNCTKNLSELIDNSQENDDFSLSHYTELSQIANISLSELCEKNKSLLVFPNKIKNTYGSIGDEKIFEMSGNIDCWGNMSAYRQESDNDIKRKSGNDANQISSQNIKIKTGNLMGFIGSGSTQIQITSRFAPIVDGRQVVETINRSTSKNDFFLHYMLSKVLCPNLLDLKFDAFSNIKNQFDYLCFLFPHFLKNAMKQGIFKTYQKFEHNNANIRGRINVPRHIAKNIPFAGKVAYTEKTHTYDNFLTQLVRHTIEVIKTKPFGKAIISDKNTKTLVSQIMEVTPAYNFFNREKIIFKNEKPLLHPFFTEWKKLQKLCLAILKNQKVNFHAESKEVYGILFDGAWLWEEYLSTVLKPIGFLHPENKEVRGGLHFFDNKVDEEKFDKNYRKIYPDFYRNDFKRHDNDTNNDNRISILDAKYKHLENGVGREDLYQVVSYIHTMSKPNENVFNGGFVFPYKNSDFDVTQSTQKPYKLSGLGGKINVIGFKIPQDAENFANFCTEMETLEKKFTFLLCPDALGNVAPAKQFRIRTKFSDFQSFCKKFRL